MDRRAPVYLHFLDRELWESTGVRPQNATLQSVLKALLLGTDVQLYCGLSLVWENPAIRTASDFVSPTILKLIEIGAIDLISQHPSLEEFVETRRELYRHDTERYPLYFQRKGGFSSIGPTASRVKTSSATKDLSRQLDVWAQGGTERAGEAPEAPGALRRVVRSALTDREDQAVTFALFRPRLEAAGISGELAKFAVRRQISRGYTSHYVDHAFGDIATGVPGLSYFDPLNKQFPEYDIELIAFLLSVCGFSQLLSRPIEEYDLEWMSIAAKRSSDLMFRASSSNVRRILRCLHAYSVDQIGVGARFDDLFGIRNAVKGLIAQYCSSLSLPVVNPKGDTVGALLSATSAVMRHLESLAELRSSMEMVVSQIGGERPKILLATATSIERDTVLRLAAGIIGTEATHEFGARRGYFRLGEIGGVSVFLVQCEMGSIGPGGSLATISDALDDIRPSAVLMVGIAFGMDAKKQAIGEVLVSRQLQMYELARMGTSAGGGKQINPRGDKVMASTQILSRLRLAEVGWTGRKIRYGVVLTGEKLVDNIDYRNELKSISGEAEGGEMEGAGLYTAAIERNIDWILVKGICDWADGNKGKNKSKRQALAAEQAVGFVFRAIQQGGFAVMNVPGRTNIV